MSMNKAEEIQMVPIKEVKLNPKNRNKHPEDQIERLAKIIEYQGFRNPLIVSSRTGLLVAGHGRLLAAKHLKLKEVPVMVQEFTDEEQEYACMVSDNAIAGWSELDLSSINQDIGDLGPEFDIDLLGIKGFEIEPADRDLGDEDDVPDTPKEAITKLGDIYRLGDHRLMCGDSTDVDRVADLMSMRSGVDMVFTDPPYGMNAVSTSGVLKKKYKTDIIGDDGIDAAVDAFNLCIGLGIPKLVFWGANYYSSKLPDSPAWLVWDKNNGGSDQMDAELAWTNLKGVTRMFTKSSEKTNRVHPNQKPVELIKWCFEKYEAGDVLDLFGGSGSTLIACEKTNRKCFMMEIDPIYCDVIVARWEKYTGKKAELING